MGGYSKDLEKRLRGPSFEAAKNKLLSDFKAMEIERREKLEKLGGDRPRKNIYQCKQCLGLVCTVDRDAGVTPFMIDCRATPDCTGMMTSSFYVAHPMLIATFEWYRPGAGDPAMAKPAVREHVNHGGLLLRPIARGDDKGGA